MTNTEWDKLPRLKPVENLKDLGKIPIELYGSIHPIAKELSEKWINGRSINVKNTSFQEDLVAVVLSAALSYATHEFHIPGRLAGNPTNSAIDRIIAVAPTGKFLPGEVNGSTIQIVCTYGINLEKRDINKAILQRISDKHSKGKSYAEHIQLAVFVTQEDWQVKANELIDKLEKEKLYSAYWVILPIFEVGEARFVVNYLGLDPEERGQGQIMIDIKNGIWARYLGLYLEDGKLDDVSAFVKYKQAKAKEVSHE